MHSISYGLKGLPGVLYGRHEPVLNPELAYRYIDLGTIEMGPYNNGTIIEAEDYVSHDIFLGVQFRF